MKQLILCGFFSLLGCVSCNSRAAFEAEGEAFLADARGALADGDFKRAKSGIKQLREQCPRALNAREQGILLLDSIELMQARADYSRMNDRLKLQVNDSHILNDSVVVWQSEREEAMRRIKFYLRKLKFDTSNIKVHE